MFRDSNNLSEYDVLNMYTDLGHISYFPTMLPVL